MGGVVYIILGLIMLGMGFFIIWETRKDKDVGPTQWFVVTLLGALCLGMGFWLGWIGIVL